MNSIKTAALIALVASTGVAFANPPATETKTTKQTTTTTTVTMPAFRSLDTDGDGIVSKVELSANTELSAKFDALDANDDGFITTSEYAKASGKSHSSSDKE